MKKIFKGLILISCLFVLLPSLVSADSMEGPLECCQLKSEVNMGSDTYVEDSIVGSNDTCIFDGATTTVDYETKEWGLICLMGSVGVVTKWIFTFLMVVSPLMIMLGTYEIVTAGMDPEKVGKGKDYIIWAAVGIIVGLFSNAIPGLITSLLA